VAGLLFPGCERFLDKLEITGWVGDEEIAPQRLTALRGAKTNNYLLTKNKKRMKKILLFASALAGLFLAGSCQKETLEPAAQGGVTYEITLPDGPQTKGENGYDVYDLHY
jgi:hypothetical protein